MIPGRYASLIVSGINHLQIAGPIALHPFPVFLAIVHTSEPVIHSILSYLRNIHVTTSAVPKIAFRFSHSGETGSAPIVLSETPLYLKLHTWLDTVYVKYDPTMLDSIGPTIELKSGPVSGSIITDPLVTIVDSIYDPSGLDSVFWKLNNGQVKVMTKSAGKYALIDSVKRENLDTIVITAVDASTRGNRSTQTIILNYIIAPKITSHPVSDTVCQGTQAIF